MFMYAFSSGILCNFSYFMISSEIFPKEHLNMLSSPCSITPNIIPVPERVPLFVCCIL